jgi:hypothetical protein
VRRLGGSSPSRGFSRVTRVAIVLKPAGNESMTSGAPGGATLAGAADRVCAVELDGHASVASMSQPLGQKGRIREFADDAVAVCGLKRHVESDSARSRRLERRVSSRRRTLTS